MTVTVTVRDARLDVPADAERFARSRNLARPYVPWTAAHPDRGTRYSTAMTGTARAFPGRGLAKPAKNASLLRARAAGYTEAFTGNDTGPMPAINKWFGYKICATEARHVRELG